MVPQDHPEIIDSLAAEYVLGTLRGRARLRFEKWRARTPLVDERVPLWEENLMQLAKGLRPIRPPAHVAGHSDAPEFISRLATTPARTRVGNSCQRVARRGLVDVALLAQHRARQVVASGDYRHTHGTQLWEVDVYSISGRLIMHTGQLPAHPADRDFELWALPAGGKPVSLGVLPYGGTAQRTLTAVQKLALANSTQVAITVEPVGGSPTGQPTTTPVFVAPLRAAS